MQAGSSNTEDEAKDEYSTEALAESLSNDVQFFLRPDDDPERPGAMNWDVYTDSLVTTFLTEDPARADPAAVRLLTALAPEGTFPLVNGRKLAQAGVEAMRKMFKRLKSVRLVDLDVVTVDTHMDVDPSSGHQVIVSRWSAMIPMKRFQKPAWMGGSKARKPDKRIVKLEAVSKFFLNAEGKIYQQVIDELNLLVDGAAVDYEKLDKFLDLLASIPR